MKEMKTLKFSFTLLILSMVTACAEDIIPGQETDEAVGYVAGYETCGLSPDNRKAKGYIVISEDLKDTLAVYGLPDIFEFPAEAFPVTTAGTGTVNTAFPERFRYAFKMRFTYTRSSEEEIHELGLNASCIIPAFYLIRSVFDKCVPVIINSATKLETPPTEGNPELTGTKWKLAAFVDVQTRESIEPEPKECSNCYTLEFNSDTTATGKSVLNTMYYTVTPSSIKMILATEIWDGDNNNASLFYDALLTIDTYEYSKDELKIYYDGKNKYLLYKPVM
ncbi:MAG: hypothetical protein LBL07_01820 [Tannerella sp.]|jgi:hypothetical protein|nr:hypothetical protein [Tannerella sp.]